MAWLSLARPLISSIMSPAMTRHLAHACGGHQRAAHRGKSLPVDGTQGEVAACGRDTGEVAACRRDTGGRRCLRTGHRGALLPADGTQGGVDACGWDTGVSH
ncbi:hypothetical protein ANANG_G00116500, partial [Anguilla anguilla]